MSRLIEICRKAKFPLMLIIPPVVVGIATLGPKLPPQISDYDKFFHFCAYAGLSAFLIFLASQHALAIIIILIAYSGLLELIQPAFDRQSEWADFAANVGGSIVGGVAVSIILLFMGYWARAREVSSLKKRP